ncbi:MAG: hypothetical protein ABFS45_14410, partial [Pseudomonadota bacterium]
VNSPQRLRQLDYAPADDQDYVRDFTERLRTDLLQKNRGPIILIGPPQKTPEKAPFIAFFCAPIFLSHHPSPIP